MRDDILPEEKLLRLIRGKKKQDTAIDEAPCIVSVVNHVEPAVKVSISSLMQKYLHFFDIRKIIWAVFAASCIYLVISFIYPVIGLKIIKLPQIAQEKVGEPKAEPKLEVKPYEFYREGIANKQIFGGVFSQGIGKPVTAVDIDLMKDINLIGIITGENPQAVIEDKKTQKTYYISKGQFIGETQVEDIQEGKIIISYRGQRIELYL